MQRTMMKSKIHRATVTEANLEYEGSITIDRELLKLSDIWPFERVEVYNITNGARFSTYAIEGEPGSRVICVNGAGAHLAKPGHKIIICSYVNLTEVELNQYRPKILFVDDKNNPKVK